MASNKSKIPKMEKIETDEENEEQTSASNGKVCDVGNQPEISYPAAVHNPVDNKCQRQDDQLLLLIFPEELWCMVLDKLKDPTRLGNLTNASPYFRQLLLPRRVHFLFPKMFRILATKIGYGIDNKNFSAYHEEGTLDDDNKPPWYFMIIKLRLICSSWQKGVDHYYDNHWLHYQMKHDPYDPKQQYCENPASIGKLTKCFKFKVGLFGASLLNTFLQHFRNTHEHNRERNPFFGRTLILGSIRNRGGISDAVMFLMRQHRQAEVNFKNLLSLMLFKYGHHIWHLVIKIEDDYESRLAYIELLREWLTMMPNLKTLQIKYIKKKTLRNNVIEQMQAELNAYSFPKLEHLKFLKCRNLPAPIFNNLVRVNNHVEKLEVSKKSIHKEYNLTAAQLDNLTELSWTICSNVDFDVLQAATINWKELNKLYLPYKPNNGTINFAQWLKVFDFCNQNLASNSKLTDLMIELPELIEPSLKYFKESVCLKLNLLSIKRLKVFMGSPCSLDFLLPMENNIQFLEIGAHYLGKQTFLHGSETHSGRLENKIEQVGQTRFFEWEDKIVGSNLWTLFPKLEKITRWDTKQIWMRGKEGVNFQLF